MTCKSFACKWFGKFPILSKKNVPFMGIDFGFLDMMKIQLKEGRDLNLMISSDTISNVLINETEKKNFGETLLRQRLC